MKNLRIFLTAAVVAIVLFAIPRWKQAQRVGKADANLEKEYGPLGRTADEILSHEDTSTAYKVPGALNYRIGQKAEARGKRGLTDTEHRLLAAYWFEAEMNNGGIEQYFSNSAGDSAEVALAGLKDMGAAGAGAILERAMAVFPGGEPPADRSKRLQVMQQIATLSKPVWEMCDSDFNKLTEHIGALSVAYARSKRAEIILP